MDTPTTDLPQPPRDAFGEAQHTHFNPDDFVEVQRPEAYEVDPHVAAAVEAVEDEQDALPTASDSPAKLGITTVRQLDERVGVMIDRINAFRVFAAKHGVDQQTNSPSLIKRQIVEALVSLSAAEGHLAAARVNTTTARETLESL